MKGYFLVNRFNPSHFIKAFFIIGLVHIANNDACVGAGVGKFVVLKIDAYVRYLAFFDFEEHEVAFFGFR